MPAEERMDPSDEVLGMEDPEVRLETIRQCGTTVIPHFRKEHCVNNGGPTPDTAPRR
jgi:hypothetical protein